VFKKSSNLKFVIIILLLATISGCFWNHKILGQDISLGSDESDYDRVALNILANQEFIQPYEGVDLEPLYFLFLSGVYKVFGHNYDAVRLIQLAFFILICLLVYLLVRELFNDKMAFFSGACLALFFPLASYSGRLLRAVPFTLLLILFVYFWHKAWISQEKKWFIFAGVVLFFGILMNAVILLLPVFFLINFLIIQRKNILNRKILTNFIIFLFIVLIMHFSGSLWDSSSGDSISSTSTTKAGSALLSRVELMEGLKGKWMHHFIGQTMGYFWVQKSDVQVTADQLFDVPTISVVNKIKYLSDNNYSPQEINNILLKEAVVEILKKPHLYLFSGFLNLISFNNPMIPNLKTLKVSRIQNLFVGTYLGLSNFIKGSIILTIRLVWLIFFFFVIYGGIKMIGNWLKYSWILITILYFNLVYSSLFAFPRYALPIYPFYVILFVFGISAFWSYINSKICFPYQK